MDAEAAMMGSVQRSKRALDEIADSGAAILSSMAGGRERLKVGFMAPACNACTTARVQTEDSALVTKTPLFKSIGVWR